LVAAGSGLVIAVAFAGFGLSGGASYATSVPPGVPPGAAVRTAAPVPQKLQPLLPDKSTAPEPEITAESERDGLFARLVSSGAPDPTLVAATEKVVAGWRALPLSMKDRPRLGPLVCHQAGCAITTTYVNARSFEKVAQKLSDAHDFFYYPGHRWRSGPISRPPAVEHTWIFSPPGGK
jgi:hypothetical protein